MLVGGMVDMQKGHCNCQVHVKSSDSLLNVHKCEHKCPCQNMYEVFNTTAFVMRCNKGKHNYVCQNM